MRRATTSPAGSAWLTAKDAVVLLSTGTPSKLGQELSRGVDPNQALEIPCMDEEILPRAALQTRWPETPEHQRRSFLKFREELLPPEGPLYAACAAELEANWAWDKSWDEHVPRPSASASVGGGGGGSGSGESSPSSSSSRNQAPSSSELDQASDARWPLLLVACMLGHTPLLLEKLLKAGADPNVTHKRSGVTALMCLTTNQRMGASAKKEGIQMLAKHGFNRWGAVRRDSCLDAILNLLIVVANTQHITRRLMSTRQLNGGPSAVSAKGGGGTGTTGAGASSLAAALKTCHKTVQDSMEVLQELLRHLLEQLAVAIVMLDATSSRVLELLTGPYARNTGFGRSTASLHLLVMKLCECTGCTFMDSVSRVQLMSLPGLLRRLVAAGVRLEEPVVTETGVVNLLEPRLMDDTKLMTAALEAGMPLGLMPTRTAGPMCSPPWRSMLAEFITEHHKRGMVEVLLRHGADPRAPVLGCIRPLALAFMSANPSAFMALRGAGAPRSDAPPSLDEILDEICLEDIQRSLVQLARMPLRTTTQPLLWRHISWLMTLSVRELLHLIPVLSSPNTSNALTLLALLRCVNSRLVSGPLQGIDFASKVEVEKEGSVVTGGGGTLGSGTTPKWAGQSSWAAVELGEHSSLIADFVQENPTCPYVPYVLLTLPYALFALLENPRLAPLLAAPAVALADRLDPPRTLARITASAITRVPGNHGSPTTANIFVDNCTGNSDFHGSSRNNRRSCSDLVNHSSTNSNSGSCSSSSSIHDSDGGSGSTSSGGGAAVVSAVAQPSPPAAPPPLLVHTPEWPPEKELPYEVLDSILRLPYVFNIWSLQWQTETIQSIAKCLWESGYPQAAIRIASAILRTEHTTAASTSTTTSKSPADHAAARQVAYTSSGVPTASTCRWRLLASVFVSTLAGLGPGVKDNAPQLPMMAWLPAMFLLLYHDPWVRALVACETVDAIAQATHRAAADAEAEGEGEAPLPAAWGEERLAHDIEFIACQAVADMSFRFSSPLAFHTIEAWVSHRVAEILAARRDAALAAGVAAGLGDIKAPSATAGGGGVSKGKKAAGAVGTPVPAQLYEPYGRWLVDVPHWVQAAATRFARDMAEWVFVEVRTEGGSRNMARALLEARAKLGPPLGP